MKCSVKKNVTILINTVIDCEQGKNSPLNRPEFVDIDVSGQGGQSSSEDEEEQ